MRNSFTIPEIRQYLKGCQLNDGKGVRLVRENMALDVAINFLEQRDSGIEYSVRQEKYYAEKAPLRKFLGLFCVRLDGGKVHRIKQILYGKRRLVLVDTGLELKTITAKEFFDEWFWGPLPKVLAFKKDNAALKKKPLP